MAHMLAAIHSTTDESPKEVDDATEREGALLHQFLRNAIEAAEEKTFAAVHVSFVINGNGNFAEIFSLTFLSSRRVEIRFFCNHPSGVCLVRFPDRNFHWGRHGAK